MNYLILMPDIIPILALFAPTQSMIELSHNKRNKIGYQDGLYAVRPTRNTATEISHIG